MDVNRCEAVANRMLTGMCRLVAASDVGMPDDGGLRYLTLRNVRRERARCPLAAIRAWNLVVSEKTHLSLA